jgi:amidase
MTMPLSPNTAFADPVGAFVPHGRVIRAPRQPGPLSGLTVAVKDLFDWAGLPTGAGNPTWLATHPVPDRDATVLAALLDAGATLHGKTVTDELAYSVHGDNVHHGTPKNAAAQGRVPGGSSSGSAAAVAAGLVDAALGTDTGGSVRVPAAYCGLFGLRTTLGLIDRKGVVPLAPSFDTVGWLTRSPKVLDALARVLLPGLEPNRFWARVLTLPEAGALTDDETRGALGMLADRIGLVTTPLVGLTDPYGGLEGLRRAYATVQGREAWRSHGGWITANSPVFGPAVAARFHVASEVTPGDADHARKVLVRFRADLHAALGTNGVLVLPSAAGPAPKVGEDEASVEDVRVRTLRLTCVAGLGGLPQLTLPFRGPDGLPRGVGLVGPAGSDRALVAWAVHLCGGG